MLLLFIRLAQRIVQGDVPQALMNRKVSIVQFLLLDIEIRTQLHISFVSY